MKKIIGIFSCIVLIIGTMFFNVFLSANTITDAGLAGKIAINVANAEIPPQEGCFYTSYWLDRCYSYGSAKSLCEPSFIFLCQN